MVVPQITVVARFVLEDDDDRPRRIGVTWSRGGAGDVTPRIEGEFDPAGVTAVPGEERAVFLVVGVGGLAVEPGSYAMTLTLDGETVGRREIVARRAERQRIDRPS